MKLKDFIELCGTDEVDKVKKILSGGMKDFAREIENGVSALMIACENQRPEMVRILIDAGANVNQLVKKEPPILFAAFHGNCEILKMLINAGASVDCTNEQSNTPLMVASNFGYIDCVREIIAAKANLNIENQDGKTALNFACINGHVDVIEALAAAGAPIDKPVPGGKNKHPLILAILKNVVCSARKLIELGASPNIVIDDLTPLMYAVKLDGDDPQMTKLFIAAGADVDYCVDGICAAVHAAHAKNVACLEALVGGGARLKRDALFAHIEDGNIRMIKALISAGADVNAVRKSDGATALALACEAGQEEVVVELYRAGAVLDTQTLTPPDLPSGEGTNQPISNNRCLSAMIIACEKEHDGIVRLLVTGGANVDFYCPFFQKSPLLSAIRHRNVKIVKILIEAGANLHLAGRPKLTPLKFAITEEMVDIVRALLTGCPAMGIKGVDPKKFTAGTQSPLLFTVMTYVNDRKSMQMLEIMVRLLLDAGADIDGSSPQTETDDPYRLLTIVSDIRNCPFAEAMEAVQMIIALGATRFNETIVSAVKSCNVPLFTVLKNASSASFLRDHTDCVIVGGVPEDYRGRRCKVIRQDGAALQSEDSAYFVRLVDQQSSKLDDNANNSSTGQSLVFRRENLRRCCSHCGAINARLKTCGACLVSRYCSSAQCRLKAGTTHKSTCQSYESLLSLQDKERAMEFISACKENDVATVLRCIVLGVDVEYSQGLGGTGMHAACQAGSLETVRLLIRGSANVNQSDAHGDSPLHLACQHGHTEIVRALLNAQANKDSVNSNGRYPLHNAADFGQAKIVKLLLSAHFRCNVNAASITDGRTPLMQASNSGWAAVVKILLQASADMDLVDKDGATALSLAEKSKHSDVVEMLAKFDQKQRQNFARTVTCVLVDLEGTDAQYNNQHVQLQSMNGTGDDCRWGVMLLNMNKQQIKVRPESLVLSCSQCFQTPSKLTRCIACKAAAYCSVKCQTKHEETHTSHCQTMCRMNSRSTQSLVDAVTRGDSSQIAMYVTLGCDVNYLNHGSSLLYGACISGNLAVVEALLEAGADHDNIVIEGLEHIPLLGAIESGNAAVVKALINAGADVDIMYQTDQSAPLHVACRFANVAIVKALLEAGADCSVANGLNHTPLCIAARIGNLQIVELLIEHGSDINHLTNDDLTPLMIAIIKGFEDIVRRLLDAAANVNFITTFNASPLLCAIKNDRVSIAKILLDSGANVRVAYAEMRARGVSSFPEQASNVIIDAMERE